jgi:hypothetical protein
VTRENRLFTAVVAGVVGFYVVESFSMFFGVGASAVYAVGTWLAFGDSLLTPTVVCGVVSGVALSVSFWRE